MVKGCIRGLIFVLEIPSLIEPILSRFVFSPKTRLISAKNYKFGKEIEVEDI